MWIVSEIETVTETVIGIEIETEIETVTETVIEREIGIPTPSLRRRAISHV